MPTNRQHLRRPHQAELTHTQELELWLGPSHNGSAFASDEHRRAAWFRHRDKLMRLWGKDGRRPQAWWRYEAPEKGLRYPGYDHERSILYEEGILSGEERAKLERWWREQFDRTWDEHFFFCAGPDKNFTGDVARELHWIWADLPPELHEKWMAKRQRHSQAIRKLEEKGTLVPAEATDEGQEPIALENEPPRRTSAV